MSQGDRKLALIGGGHRFTNWKGKRHKTLSLPEYKLVDLPSAAHSRCNGERSISTVELDRKVQVGTAPAICTTLRIQIFELSEIPAIACKKDTIAERMSDAV